MRPHRSRTLIESDWAPILRIQREVYYAIVPESELVMRSKASHSPDTCLVCVDPDATVIAYCLAYPYPQNLIPKLGVQSCEMLVGTNNLFVHDLAVQNVSSGRGVAQSLLDHLTTIARSSGFQTMSLVAIQEASSFWKRMGFVLSSQATVDASYTSDARFMIKIL